MYHPTIVNWFNSIKEYLNNFDNWMGHLQMGIIQSCFKPFTKQRSVKTSMASYIFYILKIMLSHSCEMSFSLQDTSAVAEMDDQQKSIEKELEIRGAITEVPEQRQNRQYVEGVRKCLIYRFNFFCNFNALQRVEEPAIIKYGHGQLSQLGKHGVDISLLFSYILS